MNYEKLLQSNIIDTLELSEAPKEEQDKTVARASEIILDSIIDRIEDQLPAEERKNFEYAFRDGGTEQEREKFLKIHVLNLEQITLAETLRFKHIAEIIALSEKSDL